MSFHHIPVLLAECIDGLAIRPDGIYLDGTAGGAGHSKEIAARLTTGRLIALDQDPDAVAAASQRLEGLPATVVQSNFRYADRALAQLGVDGLDGVLLGSVEPIDGLTEESADAAPAHTMALEKSSVENERNAVLLRTDSGHKVTFVQIAGLVARRIVCYARRDDRLKAGERYGLIRFGSRVDHYIPVGSDVQVAIGDKVKGVETVLAMLPKTAPGAGEASVPGEAIENGAQNGAEGDESGPDSAAKRGAHD